MQVIENETTNLLERGNPNFCSVDSVVETGSNSSTNKDYSSRRNKMRNLSVFNYELKSWAVEDNFSDIQSKGKFEDVLTEDKLLTKGIPVKTIRSLYFQNEFITPELRTGITLLEFSQSYIAKSLESIQQGKRKESDEFIIRFKEFLPELFCCRDISESFGAVINSIQNALSNMKGRPLSEKQVVALQNIVTGLLREPAMSFEKAVDYVSDFEDADFEVESVGLEGLLKLAEMMDEG